MKVVGIIRSIGERTEDFSKYLLEKQVDDVKVLKNIKPLKKSLIEYLKIGLDYDFLVINDADVFIKTNCVNMMLDNIIKNKYSMITASTISKFFNNREGGIRIFNCQYVDKMIRYLEDSDNIRPEASLHIKFKGKLIKDITSLHEYEQFYKDIYLRFVKHSIKSKSSIKRVNFSKSDDFDFKVAYNGFFDKEKDFNKSFPLIIEKEPIGVNDYESLIKKYKL